MAVAVVERFEMIDIDHQQCQLGLAAPGTSHFGIDESVELTPVGQPRQRVLEGQAFEVAIDLQELVLGVQQLDLHQVLLFHQFDKPKPQYPEKTQQQRDDAGAEQRLLAPAAEHFILVQRGKNDQRITLDPAIPYHPLDTVDDRPDRRRTRVALGQQLGEQRALGEAGADVRLLEGSANDNGGIVGDQVDHAVTAHVDAVVELQEMAEVNRRHRHPGKAAVGMIEPARNRHDPFTARTALDRRPDVRPTAGVIAMEDEVFAVGIVDAGLPGAIGIGDPLPFFVENKYTMELAQLTALGVEQQRQPGFIHAVVFQTIDQGEQQRVGLLDRCLRLRCQGLRKVGHRHFLVMQVVLARAPGFPDHDSHHRQAHCEQQDHRRADLEPGHGWPEHFNMIVDRWMSHGAP
ncbi:hypothetical protein D3C81_1020220 [compost metagenome]